MVSMRTLRGAATGAVGAGALAGAMLLSGSAVAQAAPAADHPANVATAGLHGTDVIPTRGGDGGGGGRDHDGPGQGGWGRGGGDHDGPGQRGWGPGGNGDWDRSGRGDWDRGGDSDRWGNHGDWDNWGRGWNGDWDRGGR